MCKLLLFLFTFFPIIVFAQVKIEKYAIDSASVAHQGVPRGEVIKFVFDNSKIFPGTRRDCSVYIPAQYTPDQPACVYVNQDGVQWNAPVVFDNLIYAKEMPVTIGVFISPGQVVAANDRFNRSFEYDGLGDNYVRFLLEELLPEVEKQKTSDGRTIRLSKNGNDRAIGGASSGAVCAFTAAWERPYEFSRVFSAIGTYVGLRGADRYPTLVRKYEPKAIRIFLQDGSGDLNIYGGDWWKGNESMERALTFAGYEVNHIWGEGGHNGNQGTSVFPDAMRWLWKDWPKPVAVRVSKNQFLSDILIPGQDWELVAQGYQFTGGTATNSSGEVFYQDIPNSKTYKVSTDGKLSVLPIVSKKASGTSFGSDGKRYVVTHGVNQVISYDVHGNETVVAEKIEGNDVVVAKNGNIYVTVPDGTQSPSKIYLVRLNGEKKMVDEGLKFANGIAMTPDQTQLYITESASHWVWIYNVEADGTLSHRQRFGWLHFPDDADNAWPDGIKCDTDGRVYVATRLGIQVMDQLGRVNAIIPSPAGQISNGCFGGPNFDVLYISCGDKVYRRKLKVRGANSFEPPTKPAKPRL